jgi:hypothetical protein
MLSQQDATLLILADNWQKFPSDPVQEAFVSDAKPAGRQSGCHQHTGNVAPTALEGKRDCLLDCRI